MELSAPKLKTCQSNFANLNNISTESASLQKELIITQGGGWAKGMGDEQKGGGWAEG